MADRRSFLGAVSGAAASVLLVKTAEAQGTPAAAGASAPPGSAPSASPKPPSAAARAQAESMRAFDPALSDSEIETIAHGIDGAYAAGEKLNRRGRVLANGAEPVAQFHLDAVR
jgi:hypothetical protein